MPYSGVPRDEVSVPDAVRAVAAADQITVVWANELGGLTFELTGVDRRFVKWAPVESSLDLEGEAERMRWAGRYAAHVPTVLDVRRSDEGAVLITAPIPGENAVSERWKREPLIAVRAIGSGLRALHEALPVGDCPFNWSVECRLEIAQRRNLTEPNYRDRWDESHRALTTAEAFAIAADSPPIDLAVVCHGDACAPNTLIDQGSWSGHVDLGDLGVADRWADLAVAAWSTEWNYGPGWSGHLFEAYGVEDDPERTSYYRLLWDLA